MSIVIKHQSQQGATLLIFMIILISASSYALLSKLNSAGKSYKREQITSRALAEAKQVLLGYALTYPENNAGFGPGYLPCPDRDNDGFINAGACASSTATTIGRFPWRSLGVREMLDSSGARLWYVLSDNYRNNPKINNSGGFMNSDNAGQLTLDGVGDIVALIIAPGEPVANQNRDISEFDISDEIANYLEAENADIAGAFDVDFVSSNAADFNDKVIAITRQELMGLVEKRVLGEVANTINNYQAAHNTFPWLSPFGDSSASAFRGTLSTWQGHLPFHWSSDPDSVAVAGAAPLGIVGRNPFTTDVAVRWDNIINANATADNSREDVGLTTVSSACLNDINDCDEGGIFPEITSLSPAADIDCTWSDKDSATCESFSVTMPTVAFTPNINCPAGALTRTYTITFPSFTGASTTNDPTALTNRTRDVMLVAADPNFIPAQVSAIQISDSFTGQIFSDESGWSGWPGGFSCLAPQTYLDVSTGNSTFSGDEEGSIAINNMHYDLDVDDSELPSWFVANEWQNLIYIAYASGEPLPGDTTDIAPADGIHDNSCATLVASCLAVTNENGVTNNVRATAVSVGIDISGAARSNATLTNYLESENSDPVDDSFVKNRLSNIYIMIKRE